MRYHVGFVVGISSICIGQAAVLENRAVLPRYDNLTGSASKSATRHMGDYIAAGLDLSTSNKEVITFSSTTYSSAAPTQGYNQSSNGTALGDQCWNLWARYWSLSTDPPTTWTTFTSDFTYTDWPSLVAYTTFDVDTTVTTGMGNFPTKTYTTTVQKESAIYTDVPISSVDGRTVTKFVSPSITPPPCSLPSYVPQCQSSWSSFIAAGSVEYNVPLCGQADITGELCTTFRSNWLERQSAIVSGKAGMQWDPEISNGTTVWPSNTTHYIWPTTSQLAPGCTVGCMSCRVSGSRVKVLHWLPQTTSWRNGTFVAASTANASGAVTTVTEGVTLTSPTVYISFDKLSASNSCSVIGTALSNIIVAITNSATLSSLYGWDRYYGRQQTASFNFTDLYVTPVPDDIYMSQPRCASSSVLIGYSCLPMGDRVPICASIQKSGFNCPRTLPYEPVLAMPPEVRHLQPEWNDCIGGLYGVYDPPLALHAASSKVVPTAPEGVASTSAQATEEPEQTTALQALPSPQVSSPPAPTQVLPSADSPGQSTIVDPSDDSDGEASHSVVEPVTSSQGQVIGSSPSGVHDDNTDPIQAAPPSDSPNQNDDLAAHTSPTDALGVLTQALTQTPVAVAVPTIPASDQTSREPPIVVIGGNTQGASEAESGPQTGAASFQYDPAPSVLLTFSGQPGAVIQSGTEIILHEPTRIATLQQGEAITQGSQTLVLGPEGLSVGSTTIALATPYSVSTPAVVVTVGGALYTVQPGSDGAVVQGNGIEAILVGTGTTILNGHTIAGGGNGNIVVDGTTHTVVQPTVAVEGPLVVAWTAGGEEYSAVTGPNGIILAGPSTTATISNGGVTSFASHSVSAVGGSVILVDGSTLSINDVHQPSATAILDAGNQVIVPLQSTTLTIADGLQTTVDGTAYSALSSGGAVVVHGDNTTSTISVTSSSTQSIPSVVTALTTDSTSSQPASRNSQPATSSSGASASTSRIARYQGFMIFLLVLFVAT